MVGPQCFRSRHDSCRPQFGRITNETRIGHPDDAIDPKRPGLVGNFRVRRHAKDERHCAFTGIGEPSRRAKRDPIGR